MNKHFRTILFSIFILFTCYSSFSQNITTNETKEEKTEKIKWYSFSEAVELNKKNPKKIFIDVFTSWCGWCKVMEQTTFSHPVIAKYMNEHFYCVKLDAEQKDTLIYDGHVFVNTDPTGRRSVHQFAASLLNGKMSYPTVVFLDENVKMIVPVPGYQKPKPFEAMINWIGSNEYKKNNWAEYSKTFQGEIKE